MTRSVALSRMITLETFDVEVYNGVDQQGLPSYDTEVEVEGRVKREDKLVVDSDGSNIKAELTIWVPAREAVLPDQRDRVTYESKTYIVVQVKDVKGRDAQRIHRRVRCRRAEQSYVRRIDSYCDCGSGRGGWPVARRGGWDILRVTVRLKRFTGNCSTDGEHNGRGAG